MKLKAYVAAEVRDQFGQLKHFEKKEANSLVMGFINLLYVQMGSASLANVRTIANTLKTVSINMNNLNALGSDTNPNRGIVVGSGTTAVAITDYKLTTQISHGNGAGALLYGAYSEVSPTTNGNTQSFVLSRPFTNSSGNPITVNEVGIYAYGYDGTGESDFCIDHTLLTFTIPNGATGTVTYTIQVSV